MITFVHYHQISPKLFQKHIDYYKKKYNITNLKKLAYDEPLPLNPLFITFDDGWGITYDLLPIYRQIPSLVTIFLSVNFIENKKKLTEKQIQAMKNVVNFQSHGLTHTDLTQLTIENVKKELTESKKIIEEIIDKEIYAFAYPYNRTNNKIAEEVEKAGYRLARTGDRLLNHPNRGKYQLKSIGIPTECSTTELRIRLLKAKIKTILRNHNVY